MKDFLEGVFRVIGMTTLVLISAYIGASIALEEFKGTHIVIQMDRSTIKTYGDKN